MCEVQVITKPFSPGSPTIGIYSSMIENPSPIFPPRRDGWGSLKAFFQGTVRVEDPVRGGKEDAVPAAVIAIQSFGDFLGFSPHLHMLCTDGCFYGNGMFRVVPFFDLKALEEIFRHKVFKMLLSKGKINE
jgi:hypothetical protein